MSNFGGRTRRLLCGFILGKEGSGQSFLAIFLKCMCPFYQVELMELVSREYGSFICSLGARPVSNFPVHAKYRVT